MLVVIQRVTQAYVTVENNRIAAIGQGIVALCGFAPEDNKKTLLAMLDKTLRYRLFSDERGKMNLSLQDINGGLLLVPQFTLLADTNSGLRPSFSKGASPALGQQLFEQLVYQAKLQHHSVSCGQFAADMQLSLVNDGPVTFVMSF